jgi:hypothetical protein
MAYAKKIGRVIFYLCFFYCLTFAALFYFEMRVQAYPISEKVDQLIWIAFAMLMTAICCVARRKKWAFFLSSLVVVIAAHQIAGFFLSKGFAYTKRYATEMAHAVEAEHKVQEKWPAEVPSFTAISPEGWPYEFNDKFGLDCKGLKGYCIVAGFHIWYTHKEKEELPLLSVSSRDQEIESIYNWKSMQWEDQPQRYPNHD